MNLRLLMTSRDAVAIDIVHSCIAGMNAEKVEYIQCLADDGFGVIDKAKMDVLFNGMARFSADPSWMNRTRLVGRAITSGCKKKDF